MHSSPGLDTLQARVRGLLSATTRPLPLSALIADHDLSIKLLFCRFALDIIFCLKRLRLLAFQLC